MDAKTLIPIILSGIATLISGGATYFAVLSYRLSRDTGEEALSPRIAVTDVLLRRMLTKNTDDFPALTCTLKNLGQIQVLKVNVIAYMCAGEAWNRAWEREFSTSLETGMTAELIFPVMTEPELRFTNLKAGEGSLNVNFVVVADSKRIKGYKSCFSFYYTHYTDEFKGNLSCVDVVLSDAGFSSHA